MQTPDDWNSLSHDQIIQNGGRSLFKKFTLNDLKGMGCHEYKLFYNKPKISKIQGFWKEKKNISDFFDDLKAKIKFKYC